MYYNNKEYTGKDVLNGVALGIATGLFIGVCVIGNITTTIVHNKCVEVVSELMDVYTEPHTKEEMQNETLYTIDGFDCGNNTHGIC